MDERRAVVPKYTDLYYFSVLLKSCPVLPISDAFESSPRDEVLFALLFCFIGGACDPVLVTMLAAVLQT